MLLKDFLAQRVPEWQARVRKLAKELGEIPIDTVHIRQVVGGMRGLKVLVTDISYVDPYKGIHFRGYTIPEVLEALPKPHEGAMPYVGGLYWLLMTGELPTAEQALSVEDEWKARMSLPEAVVAAIRSMPKETHPMTLFSMGILAMRNDGVFAPKYAAGLKKTELWGPTLEDALLLTGRLPALAAFIYRYKYGDGTLIEPNPDLDWGANFAHMMGIDDEIYRDLSRLYFILHSDHEVGNASAHTAHLVNSTLADVFYAFSAGMNALAGPLHGLANQNALRWLMGAYDKYGGVPTKEQMEAYSWDTLNAGRVIPGFGHAVLRATDPRYTAFYQFAEQHLPESELFRTAQVAYEVVPKVLQEQGKAKNPWPNVDAMSGVLQKHFGVEPEFYTVLFGLGRSLGITSHLTWARAVGLPIERPKSVTTDMLFEMAEAASK
ncbi:MAG: citrate (Si)-synthase [Chloroflexi bacterium]|nr:citrate (Si)-synthase [Chloroflexota bacterium]